MQVSADYNNSSFKARFINNKAFKDVVCYAAKSGKLMELDCALNILNNVNSGDILIIHGKNSLGTFSNFTYFFDRYGTRLRSSVQNLTLGALSPEESSFNAIIDLSTLGRKFRKLVRANVQKKITTNSIFEKYTTNI